MLSRTTLNTRRTGKLMAALIFSIYEFHSFLETYNNDFTKAAEAIDTFRAKVKAAGFPDLHLNGVLWGLKGELLEKAVNYFNLNSNYFLCLDPSFRPTGFSFYRIYGSGRRLF